MSKVEQFLDTEFICAFSGDLQQSKLALNMHKTNLTNSRTGTATHGQSHQNIWGTFPFTWNCSFQKGLSVVRKFSDLDILIHVSDEWDYRKTSWLQVCVMYQRFIAFLSRRWFKAVPCYVAMMVSKAPTALGSVRVMSHWNLCNAPRNTPWHCDQNQWNQGTKYCRSWYDHQRALITVPCGQYIEYFNWKEPCTLI